VAGGILAAQLATMFTTSSERASRANGALSCIFCGGRLCGRGGSLAHGGNSCTALGTPFQRPCSYRSGVARCCVRWVRSEGGSGEAASWPQVGAARLEGETCGQTNGKAEAILMEGANL